MMNTNIITKAKHGDRDAISQLWESVAEKTITIVRSKVSPSNVDDIIQDAYIVFNSCVTGYNSRKGKGDELEKFNSYYYSSLNKWLLSAEKKYRVYDEELTLEPEDNRHAPELHQTQSVGEIDDYWTRNILRDRMAGMSLQSISERYGLSVSQVRTRIKKAKQEYRP